ncbi:MAG: endonuclease/exonuclease/phosphatase family protein [Pseudonocardiaceae bacterium]
MNETLTVATYNLYLGASLIPTYSARSVPEMAETLRVAHADAGRTDFPGRAVVIAELLARQRPSLVGLQEVALWEDGDDRCDFLEILMAELAKHSEYRVAAIATSVPLAFHTDGRTIGFTDRDALLVRADLTSGESGHQLFTRRFRFPTHPGIVFTKLRGWCWIDVEIGGRSVRVATTHLEAYEASVAAAQADELRDALAARPGPVIVLGDLNSGPGQPGSAYEVLTGAGYRDAWPQLHGSADGFTGEQSFTLNNEPSALHHRVDHVLWQGGQLRPRHATLLGAHESERLPSGLWPSDHAGLVTEFVVL